MTTARISIRTRILTGFDDPTFGPEQWESLLRQGDTKVIFLTWQWLCAWWETLPSGDLLLIVAEREGKPVALAPLATMENMIYFAGPDYESYYLDFIGDISDPEVLDALLQTAIDSVPDFLGFEFYWVPDSSRTGQRLQEAANRLGLDCYELWDLPVPLIDLAGQPETALAATRKKSLVRHENFFRREGSLEVLHFQDGEAILPQLEAFFEQHTDRWALTPTPSFFPDPEKRRYYRHLTRVAADHGWLRFTRIDWNGQPIAFHFGFNYHGSYFWFQPSFAIDLARHSPGEVLIRQVLLAAIEEGAHTFDLGPGEQAYKFRFATHADHERAWGLYR